jgi:hypothetical protein
MSKLDEILDNLACASHFLVDDKCIYCDDVKLKQALYTAIMEVMPEKLDWNEEPLPHWISNNDEIVGFNECLAIVTTSLNKLFGRE